MLFRAVAWGDSVGAGGTRPRYCTLDGVAKFSTPESPYTAANELIASRLAAMIALPVPPGVVVAPPGGSAYDHKVYVSLRFGTERPPPLIPEDLVNDHVEIASGVLVFDSWIGHRDRHAANVAYVPDLVPPAVFDHDRALFGRIAQQGDEHMLRNIDDPMIGGGCIAPELTDSTYFVRWIDEVAAIPDGILRRTCEVAGRESGLGYSEIDAAFTFLSQRRDRLRGFFRDSIGLLPKVHQRDLFL